MKKIHQRLILMFIGVMAVVTATGMIASCEGMHSIGLNCGTYGIGLMLFGMVCILSMIGYIFEKLEENVKEKGERHE